jgi:hypothetical protein
VFVELLEGLSDLVLLSSDSSAVTENHFAKVDNAVVGVFAEAESSTAPVALHGGVGAVLTQMELHLSTLNLGDLACVTSDDLLNATLLVACFMGSLEWHDIATVRAVHVTVLAGAE